MLNTAINLQSLQKEVNLDFLGPARVRVDFQLDDGKTMLPAELCIDTGAGGSCISEDLYNKICAPLKAVGVVTTHAGGGTLEVIGITELSFIISGVAFKESFIVAKNLPINGILGNTFISKHVPGIYIESKHARFRSGGKKFYVPMIVPEPQPIEVNCIRACDNYTIKPKSTFSITVETDKANTEGIIDPFTWPKSAQLSCAITRMSCNELKACILNLSDSPFFLPAGMKLGMVRFV